jgi:hypothetical protein
MLTATRLKLAIGDGAVTDRSRSLRSTAVGITNLRYWARTADLEPLYARPDQNDHSTGYIHYY